MKLLFRLVKFSVFVTGSIVLLIGGFFLAAGIISNLPEIKSQVLGVSISPTITPILFQTNIPKPSETSFPTKYIPKPTNDPDPVISCTISVECGGGSKQLKKIACSRSTCCQIAGSDWRWFPSQEECRTAQNQYIKDHQPSVQNYQIPLVPTPYIPNSNTINSDSGYSSTYAECTRQNNAKIDVCNQTCDQQKDYLSEQKYNGTFNLYFQCKDKCITNNPNTCQ